MIDIFSAIFFDYNRILVKFYYLLFNIKNKKNISNNKNPKKGSGVVFKADEIHSK